MENYKDKNKSIKESTRFKTVRFMKDGSPIVNPKTPQKSSYTQIVRHLKKAFSLKTNGRSITKGEMDKIREIAKKAVKDGIQLKP
jgi:hypothetical protein